MKKTLTILLAALMLCSCGGRDRFDPAGFGAGVEYARNLSIEKSEGYTLVRVRNPWDTTLLRAQYVLIDRDSPLPDNLPDGVIIRTPVQRAAVYTSVHAAMLDNIGALDAICGICEPQYVTAEAVRRLIADGRIADLGDATGPSIEKMLDLNADVIIASPFENSGFGAAQKTGIPIVEALDYMENHPLGRTEWVKFFGLLTDRETVADSIFRATEKRYLELRTLATGADSRPTVVLEHKYGPSWGIPSGGSYIAVMHADAGASYVFADLPGGKVVNMTFEEVYDKAGDADFWFIKNDTDITTDMLKSDYKPYSQFKAYRDGGILFCNTTATTYYDDITLHPDLILEDFIAIYHPELLPDHLQRYYFPMK